MRASRTSLTLLFAALLVMVLGLAVVAHDDGGVQVRTERAATSTTTSEAVVAAAVGHNSQPSTADTTTTTVEAPPAPPVVVVPPPAPEPSSAPVEAPTPATPPSTIIEISADGPHENAAVGAIYKHFGRGALGDQAVNVASCESGFWASAVSPGGDHGLFQIREATWNKPGHHDEVADFIGRNWSLVYDPDMNAQMARRMYDKYGWGMWTCQP